jgi:glycosyltransferase involved in cell wall biosynthesis
MSWGFDMLEDAHRNIFWKKITQYVLRKSDWMLADCQTVKQTAIGFGFPGSRITVFPWGVDLNLFSPDGRSKTRKEIGFEDDLLIVHTRSWEPRYGVDITLKGFQIAANLVPNLHMIMLGGGSQERKVKDFVELHYWNRWHVDVRHLCRIFPPIWSGSPMVSKDGLSETGVRMIWQKRLS